MSQSCSASCPLDLSIPSARSRGRAERVRNTLFCAALFVTASASALFLSKVQVVAPSLLLAALL